MWMILGLWYCSCLECWLGKALQALICPQQSKYVEEFDRFI